MKIVYISNALIPSTTANSLHVMKASRSLADLGHDVTLLCPLYGSPKDRNREISQDEVFSFYNTSRNFKLQYLCVPNVKGKTFLYVLRIFLFVLFNMPNMVYSRFLLGSFLPSLFFETVFESHSPVWREGVLSRILFTTLVRLNRIRLLVLITHALECAYRDYYKSLGCRIFVAPDGSDPSVPEVSKGEVSLKGRNQNLKVGYVGHLYPGKGMEIISKIAPMLLDVDFHIIGGTDKDIQYWKSLLTGKNVFFYGFLPQTVIDNYIALLDVCLLPNSPNVKASGYGQASHDSNKGSIGSYTSPLKMFDYMSHGKAIVSSDLEVLREVLNERNSILVHYNDYAKWCSAITHMQSPEVRFDLGRQAKTDFLSLYTWRQRMRTIMRHCMAENA